MTPREQILAIFESIFSANTKPCAKRLQWIRFLRGIVWWKNRGPKIACHCPFNMFLTMLPSPPAVLRRNRRLSVLNRTMEPTAKYSSVASRPSRIVYSAGMEYSLPWAYALVATIPDHRQCGGRVHAGWTFSRTPCAMKSCHQNSIYFCGSHFPTLAKVT
jgi:hypothetical protein